MTELRRPSRFPPDAALVVILLAGLIWWARSPFQPPEPAGLEAPDTAFSAERALERLRVIAAEPHLPGTRAHREVRRYLVETLRSLGVDTEVQSTTSLRTGRESTRAAAVWNVLGRVSGTNSSGAVLLMAHYDPVPHSYGASDDGTGVAAVLEAVRALREGPPLKNDIVVVLSDAEELGLMGARAFVEGHRWASEISVVLNFEMRGSGGASLMFETGSDNGWVVRQWATADPRPVGNSVSLAVYRNMPNDTDFSPFRNRGIQGLNFAGIEGGNVYHLSLDDLSHVSPPTLQHHGAQALAMARYLGNIDLTETHAPDLAFTRVGLFGLIVYPPAWNWLGMALALALAVATLVLGLRAGTFRAKGLGAGLGLATASLLVSALFGWLCFQGAKGVHPEYGRLSGASFHREGWYFLAVMVLSLSLLLRFVGWGRRRSHLSELAWGAALLPLGSAFALTLFVPLGALNMVWSVLFGELAILFFLLRVEDQEEGGWRQARWSLGLGLLLVPVVFMMVPLAEILWMAMNISIAPVLAAVGTLTAILLLPLLAPLQRPNRWWAPVILEALVLFSFGMGLSGASPGPENPTPTSLFYAMDRDAGAAWWASAYRPREPWTRSRVSDGGLAQQEGTFIPLGDFTAPAEIVEVPDPEINVLWDTTQAGSRILRLAITSGIDAELLEIRPEEEEDVLLRGVGDWTAEDSLPRPWPLEHWGDPDGPVEIEIAIPLESSGIDLHLRETTFRPRRFLGSEAFSRPSHLIPSLGRTSDLAIFRKTIRIQVDPADT